MDENVFSSKTLVLNFSLQEKYNQTNIVIFPQSHYKT